MSGEEHLETPQPGGLISRLMLQFAGLRIGTRLTLCFAVLLGLVAAADLTGLWQFSKLSNEVGILYRVDQKSAAVEEIHTAIVDFSDNLRRLAETESPGEFANEAGRLSLTLQEETDTAKKAIQAPGAATRQDPVLLTMLATIQSTLPSQTATLVDLAKAGDWHAVHMRLDTQENALGRLTASLARVVEAEVGEQRERVLADTLGTQRQVFLIVPLTVLLALVTAGFLSVVVTRTITVPLTNLDHAAQALAQGDFSLQVPIAGRDELAHLGRVFNDSSLRLRSYHSALQQGEAKFRSYIENSPIGIFIADRDGRFVDFNQAVSHLLAYEPGLLRQITLHQIVPGAHQLALRDFLALPDNSRVAAEWELKASDGRTIPVTLLGVGLQGGLAMAYVVDLTERRQAEHERERLREEFLQAQKMESVGRLAGGVAHDFNNLLTVINGYSRLLLDTMDSRDPSRQRIEEINKAGERAAGVTKRLLAFSRKQMLQPRVIDCNRVVREVQPMLALLLGEDIELCVRSHDGATLVLADPHQLEQVILNLAVNARDAMPHGGKLLIETAVVDGGESGARSSSRVPLGPCVMLAVTDSGIGMDDETRQHVFEPFFTTKPVGQGTGLGLSMIHGIVEQSGGYIEVTSEPGKGTIFRVYLPAAGESASEFRDLGLLPAFAIRGTGTVLVVEDQAEVRGFAAEILMLYGYRVIQAGNASEALVLCEREAIDLVLTDVVMPNLSGRELADLLAKHWPGIKVLFMTGYTDDAIVHHGVLKKGVELIQKPFSAEQLAIKVQKLLATTDQVARIVIADDEAGVRKFLRMVLEGDGYQVTEAANGKEALREVRAGQVDLLITDLVMPEQEGIETIIALRKEAPGIEIIAISGAFGGSYLNVARQLGVQAVLTKPVDPDLLLGTVGELLKSRRRIV
jgi:PAS domain S-box-containing protein